MPDDRTALWTDARNAEQRHGQWSMKIRFF